MTTDITPVVQTEVSGNTMLNNLSRVSRHLCHAIGSNLEESLSYGFLSFDVRLHLVGHERRLKQRGKKKGRE